MTIQHVYEIGAIRQFLLDDNDIDTLFGGRIYGHEIPDTEANDMPRKTVLLNNAGSGRMDTSYSALDNVLIDVRCYGESPYEAKRGFDMVKGALQKLKRTEVTPTGLLPVLLYSAVQITGTYTAREPDTDWPVSYGSFRFLVSEG